MVGILLPLGFVLGQAILLDAMRVAFDPLGLGMRAEPVRRHFSQHIERMAQRLAHAFKPGQRTDGGQHMCRVGALLAPLLEPAALTGLFQYQVEQALLGSASHQAGAELGEHRMVEAGVGQVQAEGVLPVQPAAHRVRRLAVGQPFHELQHRDQRQAPGRLSRLTVHRKEVGEVLIVIEGAQRIAQLHDQCATGEAGAHNASCLRGNRRNGKNFERHGAPPWAIVSRHPGAYPTANPPLTACSLFDFATSVNSDDSLRGMTTLLTTMLALLTAILAVLYLVLN